MVATRGIWYRETYEPCFQSRPGHGNFACRLFFELEWVGSGVRRVSGAAAESRRGDVCRLGGIAESDGDSAGNGPGAEQYGGRQYDDA